MDEKFKLEQPVLVIKEDFIGIVKEYGKLNKYSCYNRTYLVEIKGKMKWFNEDELKAQEGM